MKKCGLIGKNISYSSSPNIHNLYYSENNIPFKYEIFDIEEELIDSFISNTKEENIIGFNVTIPYKERVMDNLTALVYPADIIGAVNTVVVKPSGELLGYNTDYFGFIKSLTNNGIDVKGKKVLILGNGGAAKAVYYALRDLGVASIDMSGRNVFKIERDFILVDNIFNIGNNFSLLEYDMIVNCTPIGNYNNDYSPITLTKVKKDLIIYDLNYKPSKSKLIQQGEALGLKCINGEEMLKLQAYAAADIWIKNYKDGLGDKLCTI